jgi:hypothetical protein
VERRERRPRFDERVTQLPPSPSYTRTVIFVTPTDAPNLIDVYLVDERGYIEDFLPDLPTREFWLVAWRRPDDGVALGTPAR